MARALALLVVALSLGALPGSAAYLQAGVDAARTGSASGPGLVRDDVAFALSLGSARGPGTFVVHDGSAYLGVEREGTWRIVRVELATAAAAEVAEVQGPPWLASDGSSLVVVDDDSVGAWSLEDGAPRWDTPVASTGPTDRSSGCGTPAVVEGVVYFDCTEGGRQRAVLFPRVVVRALDLATGEARWTWVLSAADETEQPVPVDASTPPFLVGFGVSVVGRLVLLGTGHIGGTPDGADYVTWALDAETGDYRWKKGHRGDLAIVTRVDPKEADVRRIAGQNPLDGVAWATGAADTLYLKLVQEVVAVDPATGATLWNVPLRSVSLAAGGAVALRDGALFVAAREHLARIDVASQEETLLYALGPGERWALDGLVVTDDVLYAASYRYSGTQTAGDSGDVLYAFDAGTGQLLWRRPIGDWETGSFSYAVDGGLVVTLTSAGELAVLGRTPAAIRPRAEASTVYPAPGEAVRVDLAGSAPGVHGPPTAFRAEWGDGVTSEWQDDAVFEHAYAEAGERTASFQARNDANQTATETVVFHVGAPEPNVLSKAFARENQDVTLFAVGLAATAIGGAVGLARLERRRGRLKRELAAIDAVVARTKDDPPAFEAALAERRARANGLLVDGKIDEAQFAVLKGRLEEVAGQVRLTALDERFHFLPYGMVHTLREMLADGKITRWEREHFVTALERDTLLTPDQKEKVKGLIDGWAQRDAGQGR